MLKIVQFTKIENEYFFFLQGNPKAFNKKQISNLIDQGVMDIEQSYIDELTSAKVA